MSWKIQEHDGWVETFPEDEYHLHSHIVGFKKSFMTTPTLFCKCDCIPRIEKEGEIFLVHHNSFDGREGVEWANEVLKQK